MELDELIQSIDIVDFISQTVELEQKGEEWWGISPFTYPPENTPSFSVRKDPPFYYDFSSGKGGNVYQFVRDTKRCNPVQAVNELKRYAGIGDDVPVSTISKMAATIDCKRFMRKKPAEKPQKGVVLPDNCMEKYTESAEKLAVWENEGISKEVLRRFQVKYDPFSDRLVYPIRSLTGKIVNIGGRTLDPEWKTKELRKYCYFYPWGTLNTIYGAAENMAEILKKREIILFEGCKSVLLASTWGISNTGAILTSHLNPSQLKLLAKLGCKVVFALDKDVDVRQDKNVQKLRQFVNVYYISDTENLLDAKDSPVDKGQDIFQKLYSKRRRYAYEW